MDEKMLTIQNSSKERIQQLEKHVQPFYERAQKHDEEASFPTENIRDLQAIGYPALTVPARYGGKEISLLELVQHQETIARADGSTALSIGWHMGIVMDLGERKVWPEEIYRNLCENILKHGHLINNASTEPATGSPTRGGKPETTAYKKDQHFVIQGRKTFTTMAPVLDYFVVSATIDGTDDVGNFLIPRGCDGVTIKETWNSVGMRATGSHDLVLENVHIPNDHLVTYVNPGNKKAAGWLLHIPACYLGIAQAALTYAVRFAKEYSPNSIEGTISELPNVKQKLGEMELFMQQSRHFLHSVARQWDESNDDERQDMKPVLGAVKHSVVNQSLHVVDLAMRVAGAKSLSRDNPLQRYYRDIRAGLHNPPMDDMTIMLLASHALDQQS